MTDGEPAIWLDELDNEIVLAALNYCLLAGAHISLLSRAGRTVSR